jgi:hypothetical protein
VRRHRPQTLLNTVSYLFQFALQERVNGLFARQRHPSRNLAQPMRLAQLSRGITLEATPQGRETQLLETVQKVQTERL